jgi:hypothetical protein
MALLASADEKSREKLLKILGTAVQIFRLLTMGSRMLFGTNGGCQSARPCAQDEQVAHHVLSFCCHGVGLSG